MKLLVITQKVDENDQLLGFSIGWFSRFAEKFDSITILCLEKGRFDLPGNVKVISLGKDKGDSKLKQLFTFYHSLFTLRREYDAVFVFMNAIWIVLGSWLWYLLGKKVFLWYAHKTITWKHQLAEKFSNGIFTSTPEGFRMRSKKIMVVGQGIDTDLFKPDISKRPSRLSILSVGRIAPIKNYEVLLRAAKILRDDGVSFHITIIGEPVFPRDVEYEKELKNMVSEMGLNNTVSFVGKIINKDLPPYYQSSHIFVNLGKTGSLDKTIVEAMASGATVISSNDAAIKFLPKELVVDGDNSQNLAEKIKEVSGKDYSHQLRQYVIENHSLNNLVEKISFHVKNKRSILIAGYPYIRENYLNTLNYYPDKDNIYVLLPDVWTIKKGQVVYKAPKRKNVFTTKAYFYHSNYPVIGGLFKGFMPGFFTFLLNNKKSKDIGLVVTLTEPILLSTLYQSIISKVFGIKHLLFTWENISYDAKFSGINLLVKNIIIKLNLLFSDGIICGNKKAAEIFKRYTHKPIANIPFSGIDTDLFKPTQREKVFKGLDLNGKILFTFVGALEFRKGIHHIVEAFKMVIKDIPEAHLLIAGSGHQEYSEHINELIKKYNLGLFITVIPWLSHDELKEVFAITDIFVYPSMSYKGWEEQLGYLLMEASSAGKAIISTNSGSVGEVIIDGKTGLLVKPDDHLELKEAMLKLAKDDRLRAELGYNARQHILENFDYKIVANKFHEFFIKFIN